MGWRLEMLLPKVISSAYSNSPPNAIPLAMVEDVALVGPLDKIRDEAAKWRDTCITTFLVGGPARMLETYAKVLL